MAFEHGLIFWIMILPLFGLLFLVLTNKSSFEQYFSKEALLKLNANTGIFTTKSRSLFLILALLFLCFAMMNPSLDIDDIEHINLEIFCLLVCFILVCLGLYSFHKFKI